MSTSAQHFADPAQPHERRLNPRILPKSLIYVACGDANGGMVLNVSDDGLAISMAIAVGDDTYSHLNVRMNGLPHSIEVYGRMVWITKSKKRAGIQLIDVSDIQREQIRDWIALEGVRDVNLLPRVVTEDNVSSSQQVVTSATISPTVSAEPRSTLLDAFGGSAPESLGPTVPGWFSSDDAATPHIEPSQGFDNVNAAGFRDNEWDLAAVTMVPRKKPKPEGLSAFGLMLLWIAILSFGIGILVGRRPLEQWLSRGDAVGKSTSKTTEPGIETTNASQESPVSRDLDAKAFEVPQSTLPVRVEHLVGTDLTGVKPANAYRPRDSSGTVVDTKLLNSMSAQEARAFKNLNAVNGATYATPKQSSSNLDAKANRAGVSSISSETARPKTFPPESVVATMPNYKPENPSGLPASEADTKNSKLAAAPSIVPRNSENPTAPGLEKDYGDHVSKTLSIDTGLNAAATKNPSVNSAQSASSNITPQAVVARSAPAAKVQQTPNAPAPTAAVANVPTLANSTTARQNIPASGTPPSLQSTNTPPPATGTSSLQINYPSRNNPVGPGGIVTKFPPASVSAPSSASSNAAAMTPMSPSSPSTRSIAPNAAPTLAPVTAQPPLHGVMLVARKNDESFLLKLPMESVPGGRSTSVRMQRFVMVPQQSRWHHHGPVAKLTVGELLTRVAPDKPDASVKPRAGETVTVRAFVDKNGSVQDLKPVSGRFGLMPRVMRSVRDWQFDQTLIDGKPVESEVNVTVEFRPTS